MKKLLIFILLLIGGQSIHADSIIHYTETVPDTLIKKRYGKSQVKGKKIMKIDGYSGTNYYVYTSQKIATVIRFPYPIKEIINPGKELVLDTIKQIGETYFVLTALTASTSKGPNIHVICENGFSVILETIISTEDDANQLIEFEIESEQPLSSVKKLQRKLSLQEASLKQKNTLIDAMVTHDTLTLPFSQTIQVKQQNTFYNLISCKQLNMTETNLGTYLFTVERLETTNSLDKKSSIFLEVQPFSDFIISETLQSKSVYQPTLSFNLTPTKTLYVFEIESPGDTFYFTLSLNPWTRFSNRFDLNHLKGKRMNTSFKNVL
jgi:hypothetical protein